jgi:hypothetical protein
MPFSRDTAVLDDTPIKQAIEALPKHAIGPALPIPMFS